MTDDIPVLPPKRRKDPATKLPIEGKAFNPPALLQAAVKRADKLNVQFSVRVMRTTNKYIKEYQTAVPTVPGLCLALGVSEKTVKGWEGKHPTFADALQRLRAIQHELLIHGGLRGELNASIVKTMLAARHDYKEGREISGPGGAPIPIAATAMTPETAERLYFESIGRKRP